MTERSRQGNGADSEWATAMQPSVQAAACLSSARQQKQSRACSGRGVWTTGQVMLTIVLEVPLQIPVLLLAALLQPKFQVRLPLLGSTNCRRAGDMLLAGLLAHSNRISAAAGWRPWCRAAAASSHILARCRVVQVRRVEGGPAALLHSCKHPAHVKADAPTNHVPLMFCHATGTATHGMHRDAGVYGMHQHDVQAAHRVSLVGGGQLREGAVRGALDRSKGGAGGRHRGRRRASGVQLAADLEHDALQHVP